MSDLIAYGYTHFCRLQQQMSVSFIAELTAADRSQRSSFVPVDCLH